MISFFKTTIYIPLYNVLVALVAFIPTHDVGLAIVSLTILVRSLLTPLQHQATKSQQKVKALEPELAKIKQEHKDNKELQAQKIMELYKEHNFNPFGSILPLFIQIPIILSLFYIARSGFDLNTVHIYSFTPLPTNLNLKFLGLINIQGHNIVLAIVVALTQFWFAHLSPRLSFDNKQDFAKAMDLQMRYFLPIIIGFTAAALPAAVSLYWVTSNLFSVAYELVRRLPTQSKLTTGSH